MQKSRTGEYISAVLLLFVGLIWGATFPVIKIAIESTGALWFNAYRFLIAAILAFLVLIFNGKKFSQEKGLVPYAFILGSLLAFGYTTQTVGLAYTESGKAGFITGLFVVLVPIFSSIVFKKRPSAAVSLSVLLSLVGLALLSLGKNFIPQKGDVLVFLCAVGYAIHIVIVDHITHRFNSLNLSMSQIIVAGLEMFILAYIIQPNLPTPSRYAIFALFLTSIFATIVAFFIQIFAQKHLGPTKTALILLTEPVFAAVFGYLLLNEIFTMRKVLGSILLLVSMVIAEIFGHEN
ncbi:MAG: DMT family transporter [Actinobacteria bacterium]|nr:DMT family transporter [Actinomycetota bacterium]